MTSAADNSNSSRPPAHETTTAPDSTKSNLAQKDSADAPDSENHDISTTTSTTVTSMPQQQQQHQNHSSGTTHGNDVITGSKITAPLSETTTSSSSTEPENTSNAENQQLKQQKMESLPSSSQHDDLNSSNNANVNENPKENSPLSTTTQQQQQSHQQQQENDSSIHTESGNQDSSDASAAENSNASADSNNSQQKSSASSSSSPSSKQQQQLQEKKLLNSSTEGSHEKQDSNNHHQKSNPGQNANDTTSPSDTLLQNKFSSLSQIHLQHPLLQQFRENLLDSLSQQNQGQDASSSSSSMMESLLHKMDNLLQNDPSEQKPSQQQQDDSQLRDQIKTLTKQLKEEKQKYDHYSKKVDKWKESVKQISKKDLAKINALKKTVQQLNDQVADLKNENQQLQQLKDKQWKQKFSPLNEHYDILERVTVHSSSGAHTSTESSATSESKDDPSESNGQSEEGGETDSSASASTQDQSSPTFTTWTLIGYDDAALGSQWILDTNISSEKRKRLASLPPTIQQRLKRQFENEKQSLQHRIDTAEQRASQADNSLAQYKSRAHQALKKKAESLNTLKLNHEREISEMEEEISQLKESVNNLEQSNTELNDTLNPLLELQEEHLSLKTEFTEQKRAMQELQTSYDMQQAKLKSLESESAQSTQDAQEKYSQLMKQHEQEVESLKTANSRLEEKLSLLRERHRQDINEKDSKITVYQQTCSELKQRIQTLTEVKTLNVESTSGSLHDGSSDLHEAHSLSSTEPNSIGGGSSNDDKDEQEVKLFRSIVEDSGTTQSPTSSVADRHSRSLSRESGATGEWAEVSLTEDANSARVMELAEKFAQQDAQLQDKIQFIQILKESLATKTSEVAQLKHTEKQLRHQITRLQESNRSGSPNLEYFKNVFLKFIGTDDPTVRSHSIRALGQLLSLPRDEIRKLEQQVTEQTSGRSLSTWFGGR